jgi:hypothetical protein
VQIDDQFTALADQFKAAAQSVGDSNREILAQITARLDASENENKTLRERVSTLTEQLTATIERLDDIELELDQREPAEPASPFHKSESEAA